MSAHMMTTPNGVPAIATHTLSRRFRRVWALRRVTLAIAQGESVALVGPNGSGKSTLLKLIATVLTPTRGSVSVMGRELSVAGDDVRRAVGLMSHQTYLYGDLTARENLRFAMRMHGIRRSDEELLALLARVGLAEAAHKLLRGFSQGMSQRLGLARALLHDPEILLLDEPYSALDPDGARVVDRLLAERRQAGHTTVLVTHHVERALDLCERAVALKEGQVAFDGPVHAFAASAVTAAGRA
jgi:heme exporter protein A